MGIFSRSKKTVVVEKRNEDNQSGYSVPVSLGLLKGLKGNPTSLSAVYAATSLISNTIASIPIHVRDTETGKIVAHPVANVFDNGLLSRFIFIKQLVTDMLIHGNGIAYINRSADGSPSKLTYIQHGNYLIDYNENTRQLYYRIPTISSGRIEPINIIHIYKDTKNGVEGRGIREIAGNTLALALAADSAAKDFYESGCDLSAILKSTRPLTNEQKLDIKTNWITSRNESTRGNSVAVLGNDLEYVPIGTNAADAQLLETRAFNISEVCRYFNISPCLLGDMSGASQYGSLEQAQLDFLLHCIMPLVNMIEAEFNRKLFRPSEKNIYIDFDENHLMLGDKSAQATYYSTLVSAGIMSINEAREQLGLTDVEGADNLIIPYTKITDNVVGDTTE